jgi:hypothetical protein
MLKGDKYFELIKVAKFSEVMRAYKNRNSPLIYLTGLANKDFTLLLAFNSALMLFDLDALSNALLGRRSHDNVLIISEVRFLFQLDRDSVAQWVRQ